MTTLTTPRVNTPAATTAPALPSVHVRAVLTWTAIFPMVTLGMTIMAPYTAHWPLALRALVLTAFVVPSAVYLVVPRLLALHAAATRRSSAR